MEGGRLLSGKDLFGEHGIDYSGKVLWQAEMIDGGYLVHFLVVCLGLTRKKLHVRRLEIGKGLDWLMIVEVGGRTTG